MKTACILFISCLLCLPAFAAGEPSTEESLAAQAAAAHGTPRIKALAALAAWYDRAQDPERAVATYRQALRENPRRRDAYQIAISVGDIHLRQRQYTLAIEAYQEAAALDPRADAAHLKLARTYEQSELYELARQEYVGVSLRSKKSFEANFGLASLFLDQGITGQAMEYFRRALMLRPEANVYRQMARCAESMGQLDLAVAMLGQIIPAARTYEDELARGRLFEELKKYKESEGAYSQAIKCDPDRIEGCIALALLYIRNNDLTPAQKLLELARDKAPGEGIIHFFLATIYYRQHEPAAARDELRRAVALARSDILARYGSMFDGILDGGADLPGDQNHRAVPATVK